jgi:hypothetical protein
MDAVPVFREIVERPVWVQSASRVTFFCTKFAKVFHEFSSSLSSQLHEQMSCWTHEDKAMHCGLDPAMKVLAFLS